MTVYYTKVQVEAVAHNLEVSFETCTHHTNISTGGPCWHATLQEPTSPSIVANWDVMDRISLWHAVIDAIRTEVITQIESEIGSWKGGVP